ncbi:MAG: hypothetical protein ACO2PN_02720 [Pyrobaculum sp.]
MVEIAKVMRIFPWMVEVIRQRQVGILHPYMVEVYVARDGSEACLSLNSPNCARDGAVKEGAELEFAGFELYEGATEKCTARRACWPTPRLGPGGSSP